MEEKKAKRYIIRTIGLFFVIVFLWSIYQSFVSNRNFKNSSYQGVVNCKVYKPEHGGAPSIRIDTTWNDFGSYEWDVIPIVEVRDSLVKKCGSKRIHIYRKNIKGAWMEIKY